MLFMAVTLSYGQELNLPVFTQYLADNDFVVSPTYAGIGDNFRLRANGLTQWVGIKGAPDNMSLYADFRIADRSGVGLSMYTDKNGNTRQKGAKISYAHHLLLDYYSKQYLSFGISYNLNSFRLNIEDFNSNYDAPIIDPYITDDRATTNSNFDAGVLYRNKGYFLSFNANNLLKKDIEDFAKMEPRRLLNYQIYTGLVIQSPGDKTVEFEPSVYYQMFSSDQRSSTDINFKYRKFNDRKGGDDYYWAGVSYRFLNDQMFKPLNLGPMVGIMKSKFYFAYSYQITINGLSGYNSGTHMITLGLDFLQGVSNCPCTMSPIRQ